MITFCRNCGEKSEYTDPKNRPPFCSKCKEVSTAKQETTHRPPETPASTPSADRPPTVKAVVAAVPPPRPVEAPRPKKWMIKITERDEQGDWKTAEIETI